MVMRSRSSQKTATVATTTHNTKGTKPLSCSSASHEPCCSTAERTDVGGLVFVLVLVVVLVEFMMLVVVVVSTVAVVAVVVVTVVVVVVAMVVLSTVLV
jgi:hypothetical protein